MTPNCIYAVAAQDMQERQPPARAKQVLMVRRPVAEMWLAGAAEVSQQAQRMDVLQGKRDPLAWSQKLVWRSQVAELALPSP